ncbi:hypothetical protein D3C87_1350510 [compost metagenome]
MVRERGALRGQPRARAVRLLAAHPLAAHLPREPARARCRLRGGLRTMAGRPGRRAARDAAPARRRSPTRPAADVHAVPRARRHPQEPRGGQPDGDVFVGRWRAGRFPPRAPGRAGAGRGGHGRGRDDLRVPGRADHAGLPRAVERHPARCVAPDRRFRARQQRRDDRHPAGPCGPQGLDPAGLGEDGLPAGGGQLAADLGVAAALPARHLADAARDDPRRHGAGAR